MPFFQLSIVFRTPSSSRCCHGASDGRASPELRYPLHEGSTLVVTRKRVDPQSIGLPRSDCSSAMKQAAMLRLFPTSPYGVDTMLVSWRERLPANEM